MCYAIPGQVISVRGRIATIDYFGEKRTVINEFSDLLEGEYVYAQGGIIIERVAAIEAQEILGNWKKAFFKLKDIDGKIAVHPEKSAISEIAKKKDIEKEDILALLRTNDEKHLFKEANAIRRENLENACCVHGIIEFSNYCRSSCLYCGIRKESPVKRYRMTPEEIIETAEIAVGKYGFKALVLQSGEDMHYSDEMLSEIIRKIRHLGVLIFVSVGDRSVESYKMFYESGARAALIRFESSNPEIYSKMRGKKLEDRIDLIKKCSEIGYLIATGSIIGLPGQTTEDIANDIILTRELKAEMYSFGPLIPHHGTPLFKINKPDINIMLKAIAAMRIADKNSKILVTTALETLDPKGKMGGLMCGGNSLMINLTPEKYRNLYEIYPDKAGNANNIEENIAKTLRLLHSLGRAPTDLGA